MSKIKSKKSLSFSESDRLKPPAWLRVAILKQTPTLFNLKLSEMIFFKVKVIAIVICISFVSIFTSCNKENPIAAECNNCQLCPENPLCKNPDFETSCTDCNLCPDECTPAESCPNDTGCASHINQKISSMQFYKQAPPVDPPVLFSTKFEEGDGLSCTVNEYGLARSISNPILYDPTSDVIWLGNILDGQSIANGGYQPVLNTNRKSLVFSASGQAFNTATATVQKPTLSNYRQSMQSILNGGFNGIPSGTIDYQAEEIHSTEHLKVLLEGNLKVPFSSLAAEYNFNDKSIKSRILIKYTQIYYTISLDIPNTPSEFFTDIPEGLNELNYGPVYVSSIKYGRSIVAMASSTEESEKVKAAIKASFKFIFKGGIRLSLEEENTLKRTTISVSQLGGTPTAISSIEDVATFISEGVIPSPESNGAPLSYTLRYLKDNSIAEIVLAANYNVRRCVIKPTVHTFTPSPVIRFYPSERIAGDKEFSGNGPEVWAEAEVYINGNNKELMLRKFFRARETRSDHSEGRKTEVTTLLYAPPGKKFHKIVSHKSSKGHYVDNDGALDILSSTQCNEENCTFAGDLVNRFEIIGDTPGDDLNQNGDHDCNLDIYFNPITYELVDG